MSCFACKIRESKNFAHCVLQDGITPLLEKVFGVTDPTQFEDCGIMIGNQFDPEHKKQHHEKHFPITLKNAY